MSDTLSYSETLTVPESYVSKVDAAVAPARKAGMDRPRAGGPGDQLRGPDHGQRLFAFLLSSSVVVKMLALVLGASVIIDARSSACSSSRR